MGHGCGRCACPPTSVSGGHPLPPAGARIVGRAARDTGAATHTDRGHHPPCPASRGCVPRPRWPAGSAGTSGWRGPRRGKPPRRPDIAVVCASSPPLPRWRPFGVPPIAAVQWQEARPQSPVRSANAAAPESSRPSSVHGSGSAGGRRPPAPPQRRSYIRGRAARWPWVPRPGHPAPAPPPRVGRR